MSDFDPLSDDWPLKMDAAQVSEILLPSAAHLAHEVNRAYCQSLGDDTQPTWDDAPEWQRESAVAGMRAHFFNDLTPEQSHESWLAHKRAAGWTYGEIKDAARKTHPCLLPYRELPAEQKTKDYLFAAIAKLFRPAV